MVPLLWLVLWLVGVGMGLVVVVVGEARISSYMPLFGLVVASLEMGVGIVAGFVV